MDIGSDSKLEGFFLKRDLRFTIKSYAFFQGSSENSILKIIIFIVSYVYLELYFFWKSVTQI